MKVTFPNFEISIPESIEFPGNEETISVDMKDRAKIGIYGYMFTTYINESSEDWSRTVITDEPLTLELINTYCSRFTKNIIENT